MYLADVTDDQEGLAVTLKGAAFRSNRFRGVRRPDDQTVFTIRPAVPWDYDAFDVVEILGDGTLFIISGVITARNTADGFFGSGGEMRPNRADAWCSIDSFELVPVSGRQ